MDTGEFWHLIDALQGSTETVAVKRSVKALERLPEPELEDFSTRLAKAVYDLDTERLFAQPIKTDEFEPGDVDENLFVSVRCAVVAAGREAYESVMRDPAELSRRHDWSISSGEAILQAADEAYQGQSAVPWTFSPPWETETGNNKAGWPDAIVTEGDSAEVAEPDEWISVDYHTDDSRIADLFDRPARFTEIVEAADVAAKQYADDASYCQKYMALGSETVSLTVHFLTPKGKPPERVKRRGGEIEITLGRHLEAKFARGDYLTNWMVEYVRDSLDLGVQRLGRKR